jgi:S-formylglutathione hydrolase
MTINIISQYKCFGGMQYIYEHLSQATGSKMRFGLFLPPLKTSATFPALYWLSGLTCTEENFIIKAGAQRVAAELGLALVSPDTSPRGLPLSNECGHYDIGEGASFYLDATRTPWSSHYRMYSYIAKELPMLVAEHFPIDTQRVGLFGHSMGGHGALTIALKHPDYFKSLSAFSPISSVMQCPWGKKALSIYLGDDPIAWEDYDATKLIITHGWCGPPILVDQGTKDPFLTEQLKPDLLQKACLDAGVALNLRMQAGYDHSYYFIATFIEDHLRFHSQNLIGKTIPIAN